MRIWSGYRALHSPKGWGVKRFKCRYIVLPVNVSDRQDASPQGGGGGGGGGKKILGWGVLTALQKRKQRTSKEGKFCTGRNNRRRQRQGTLVTLKEGQRVFSTVMQVGIKMSTQKHQGVCAQRRTESRLYLCAAGSNVPRICTSTHAEGCQAMLAVQRLIRIMQIDYIYAH